ncbi:putative methyltransferase [Actinacidiphila reveromycinica]|uniref:Putative methyltransferase n=1 Tax=Actinacidiphila reveromycinica TaxID=659352 RepID=A0A7U3VSN8_9ACTN|nr:methyltransferase domain-containing protein [Streptomyces sp. SN-593]BBB01900.1 putative methyltransferase [Streptomyces sp. SN-593]
MLELRSFTRSLERSRRALNRTDRPATFALAGREWDLLGGVFSPADSATTRVAAEVLGLAGGTQPDFWRQGSFLEIGCGTGVIAVSAALAGCPRVVATDVNPAAVRNAEANVARHGVADRVRVVHSDLFAALDPAERFDTVYWHSNFVLAPDDYPYATDHERAYVDPGYRAHRRYLTGAPELLTEGGSALLQFSDRGDLALLHDIAAECGRELRVFDRREFLEGGERIAHLLLGITAAGRPGAAAG